MLAQEGDSAFVFHERPRGSRDYFTEHGPFANERASIRYFVVYYNLSYRYGTHAYSTGIFSSRHIVSRK